MSNISRRDFLKTAGVMTLAVAAAGAMAGCSTAASSVAPSVSSSTSSTADNTQITETTTIPGTGATLTVVGEHIVVAGDAGADDKHYMAAKVTLKQPTNSVALKDLESYVGVAGSNNAVTQITAITVNGVNCDASGAYKYDKDAWVKSSYATKSSSNVWDCIKGISRTAGAKTEGYTLIPLSVAHFNQTVQDVVKIKITLNGNADSTFTVEVKVPAAK